MTTLTQRLDEREAASVATGASSSAVSAIAIVIALAALLLGIVGSGRRADGGAYAALVIVGAWVIATAVVALRRRTELFPLWLALATAAGAAAVATDRLAGAAPFAFAALSTTLPTGALSP